MQGISEFVKKPIACTRNNLVIVIPTTFLRAMTGFLVTGEFLVTIYRILKPPWWVNLFCYCHQEAFIEFGKYPKFCSAEVNFFQFFFAQERTPPLSFGFASGCINRKTLIRDFWPSANKRKHMPLKDEPLFGWVKRNKKEAFSLAEEFTA